MRRDIFHKDVSNSKIDLVSKTVLSQLKFDVVDEQLKQFFFVLFLLLSDSAHRKHHSLHLNIKLPNHDTHEQLLSATQTRVI